MKLVGPSTDMLGYFIVNDPCLDDKNVSASLNFARICVAEQIMFDGAAIMFSTVDDRRLRLTENIVVSPLRIIVSY